MSNNTTQTVTRIDLGPCEYCNRPQYLIENVKGEVIKKSLCHHPKEAWLEKNNRLQLLRCTNCSTTYDFKIASEMGIYRPKKRISIKQLVLTTALREHEIKTNRAVLTPFPEQAEKFGKCIGCNLTFKGFK